MTVPDAFSNKPLHRRRPAQAVPLELFERLYGGDAYGFLYESLESHGGRGRYSFLGGRPALIFRSKGNHVEIERPGRPARAEFAAHPMERLRALVARRRPPAMDGVYRAASTCDHDPPGAAAVVPPFSSGAVGYLGYDMIRLFENIPAENPDPLAHPDSFFLFPDEIVVLDHRENVAHIIVYNADDAPARAAEIDAALNDATPPSAAAADRAPASAGSRLERMTPNMPRRRFERGVERGKEYIRAGDIFQVVLSQRFSFDVPTPPIDLYRALRVTNPSPYMYYLTLGALHVLGSSPEVLVKLAGRTVTTRPLAGTRRRGRSADEDDALARELQNDDKERAEHVMLVDLARNDIGRVCEFGSVRVTDVLGIERYSKVMHLVSGVEGLLRRDRDAFDLVAAAFPAGTVSGAPKIRAMQIIDELEPESRGIYAGAIGYFSPTGHMDLCIGIRTIVVDGEKGYIQAGAGIVADSIPEREYAETLNKAAGLFRAVELASADALRRTPGSTSPRADRARRLQG